MSTKHTTSETEHKKKEPTHKEPTHKKPTGSAPTTTTSTTTYTLVTMPDDGLTAIYNLLSSATKTIDMTMYELTDTQVTSILTTAVSKGVGHA